MNFFVKKFNKYYNNKVPFVFIVNFEMTEAIVYSIAEAGREGLLFQAGNFSNISGTPKKPITPLRLQTEPVSYVRYKLAFDTVMDNLRYGNSYLLNLTFPTPVKINWQPADIFYAGQAKYKILLKDKFLCFSPETFVTIDGTGISTFPMKGTIDASVPDAEAIILADEKEKAEHATIVDLLRNDLSMVAEKVEVKRYRYVSEVRSLQRNLLQVSSEITGRISKEYWNNVAELILKLLPAGSVSGAPKEKTIEIIRSAEGENRGYYSGVFGFFDGNKLDSCILIRTIEEKNDRYYYRSGGGITVNSDPQKEYKELNDKIYVPVI
ncbi:MAG: aminodeoxychorismate synthase component I [Ignavibacteriales bacterium]|nr:aminodeoxychorismate synthase component I [Ignavibacteriales bacterium]MCF8314998.1 aminodeoxychorismate synthase component I [Ignavibacteriales bacterium]MCF8436006.1 aminodeoxychorismate synthase component I [Ignavibacteriales bacterium]